MHSLSPTDSKAYKKYKRTTVTSQGRGSLILFLRTLFFQTSLLLIFFLPVRGFWGSSPQAFAANEKKISKHCVNYLRASSMVSLGHSELQSQLQIYSEMMIKRFNSGMTYFEHGHPYDIKKIKAIFDRKTNTMALNTLALIRQYPENEESLKAFNVANEYIDLYEQLLVFPDNTPTVANKSTFSFGLSHYSNVPFIEMKLILFECYIELLKAHGTTYILAISRAAKEAPLMAATGGNLQAYAPFQPYLDYLENHESPRVHRHLQRRLIYLGDKFMRLRKRPSRP